MLTKNCITTEKDKTRFFITTKKGVDSIYNSPENLLIRPTTMWTKEEFKSSIGLEKKEICKKKGNVHYIIFSMHASLSELKSFVKLVEPKEIYSINNTMINLSILRDKKRKTGTQFSSQDECPTQKELKPSQNSQEDDYSKSSLSLSYPNDDETEDLFNSII